MGTNHPKYTEQFEEVKLRTQQLKFPQAKAEKVDKLLEEVNV
jgi:hypothetical protein